MDTLIALSHYLMEPCAPLLKRLSLAGQRIIRPYSTIQRRLPAQTAATPDTSVPEDAPTLDAVVKAI